MLRNKRDSLKGIPSEVRHSLQILDNLLDEFDDQKDGMPVPILRNVEKVPPDARKSLAILDNVLGEFDINNEESCRRESADNLGAVNDSVNKSLEALDNVLDEFQSGDIRTVHTKKQVFLRNESLRRPRHEDVRRSLEVLDSVLAEFDDCLESWDNLSHDVEPPADESPRNGNEKEICASDNLPVSYDSLITDGSTSHDSGLSLPEQIKISSPPPVPKRSASTKLSDRNSGLFTFSDTYDSLPSDLGSQDNETNLSTNGAISTLSAKADDEVFRTVNDNAKAYCCAKCGSEIEVKGHPMESRAADKDASSSPFSERRKMFEDRIVESKISVSPLLERSFIGSSFKVRSERLKECVSEPTSLLYFKSTDDPPRSDSSYSSFSTKYSPKATKVDPPRVDGLLSLPNNPQHAPNCNCKERIRLLQIKFAETRRLLKANKIRGIESKPPSFVPPPPPLEVAVKNALNDGHHAKKQLPNGDFENAGASDSISYSASNGSLNSESLNSEISETSYPSPVPDSEKYSDVIVSHTNEEKLCDKCSSGSLPSGTSGSLPISETIEDISKLRPTDALKRPHLGLSYSMEDDFNPGVKEILQTSTPKNGLGLSRNNKTASLSTFSLSDSSLGYVSSQSDLEISNSPLNVEKVPVSSIKFSTLPEGMNLHSLPSYYGNDENSGKDRKSNQLLYRDRNFNHTTDPQLRSSSAPPPPEVEKPKKKHFRGFSRKDKDKKKNGELNVELAGRRANLLATHH